MRRKEEIIEPGVKSLKILAVAIVATLMVLCYIKFISSVLDGMIKGSDRTEKTIYMSWPTTDTITGDVTIANVGVATVNKEGGR